MKTQFPNPLLLIGILVSPAGIGILAGLPGSFLFILPILAGAICGLCFYFGNQAGNRRRRRGILEGSVFGLLCALASLAFVSGACATSPGPPRPEIDHSRVYSLADIVARRAELDGKIVQVNLGHQTTVDREPTESGYWEGKAGNQGDVPVIFPKAGLETFQKGGIVYAAISAQGKHPLTLVGSRIEGVEKKLMW